MSDTLNQKPTILAIDDKPEQLRSGMKAVLQPDVDVEVLHPADIDADDLTAVDLILVDYRLDDWIDWDREPASQRIQTGFALAPILQQIIESASPDGYTSVALHTGHLGDASGNPSLSHKQHLVATLRGFDWVFDKQDAERFGQMRLLASAARRLHGRWPSDLASSEKRVQDLLDLAEDTPWFMPCWEDIQGCHPPLHQLSKGASRSLFPRWLIQEILPYPCFLWDEHAVAARLHLSVCELRRVLSTDNALAGELQSREYRGILAGFFGRQWWRGAIEQYFWNLSGGSSGDMTQLDRSLREMSGIDLRISEIRSPVVHLDADLRPAGIASAADVVRLWPDHWPTFADTAWARTVDVTRDPTLAAMLDPFETYRIPTDNGD